MNQEDPLFSNITETFHNRPHSRERAAHELMRLQLAQPGAGGEILNLPTDGRDRAAGGVHHNRSDEAGIRGHRDRDVHHARPLQLSQGRGGQRCPPHLPAAAGVTTGGGQRCPPPPPAAAESGQREVRYVQSTSPQGVVRSRREVKFY